MTFPNGVTKWGKFVAFNLAKSDFCKKFEDSEILNIGYMLYFADEDGARTTKYPQQRLGNMSVAKKQ